VRLAALGRSDPIPCARTGRRHRGLLHSDEMITAYFHMMDTGTRFSLDIHPDLRIGPDQPPSANRFTEKFGLGACTNGFADKAHSFDYKCRRWASNPQPSWVPEWTESLKAKIEVTTGVPASRQHLLFNGCGVGSDSSTVRVCGITPGVELQIFIKKKEPSRDLRSVVLACTAKRRETEDARQELEEAKLRLEAQAATSPPQCSRGLTRQLTMQSLTSQGSQGNSPKRCVMPPWKTQDIPNLFGGKVDSGEGRGQASLKPEVPSFEEVPIFRADIQDRLLQRVRSLPCYTSTAARY